MKTEGFYNLILMYFWVKIKTTFQLLVCLILAVDHLSVGQVQGFEEPFDIVNHPEEFLPYWSANEVRSTNARVFQALGKGRNGTHALGIQPLSTFDGQVYWRVQIQDYENPKLAFFAKTESNGTGSRPAILSISFAKKDGTAFTNTIQIGTSETFPNRNTTFQRFEIPIPAEFSNAKELTIRWSISIGIGTGSAARLILDDVGIWEMDAIVDPIKILQATLLNPYRVELVADRSLSTIQPSQINLEGKVPKSVIQPTDTLVWLESAEPLQGLNLEIEITEMQEKTGERTPEIMISIPNEALQIGNVFPVSPKEILIEFSHPYLPSEVSQTSKFFVNGKNPLEIELLQNGYGAWLKLSDELPENRYFIIECREITSALSSIKNPLIRKTILYVDGVSEIHAISPSSISISYKGKLRTELIDKEYFKFPEDSEFKFDVDYPDSTTILLRTELEMEDERAYQLTIPPITTTRGFTFPGLWKNVVWDISPPELTHVLPVHGNKLLLTFSENLDPAFALNKEAYRIGTNRPLSIDAQPKPNQVLTTWGLTFIEGSIYEIIIAGVLDQNGNSNDFQQFEFTYQKPEPLGFKSLVINEIMPAPKAGNSLPNAEYVEIMNTGKNPVFIGGMQLANPRRQAQIPSYSIDPGEILILCSRTHTPLFTKYGKVLGLGNWPSMLNSGDRIRLLSADGEVLDSLNYTTASFGGSSFASGGYSLEIANPFLDCYLPGNLKTSLAPERGTPGKHNSVFDPSPDLTPLRFVESLVVGDSMVMLRFNKTLQPTLSDLDLKIAPLIRIQKVGIGPQPNELAIRFGQTIPEKTLYQVSIRNLRDCTGNLLEESQVIKFARPSAAEIGDLVINEVLFNPRAGAPKFVEIYNASEKYINLKDWKLANLNGDGSLANRKVVYPQDFIITPKTFLVFTTDRERLKQEYPKGIERQFVEAVLPSYPIQRGNVALISPDESVQEIFSYDESMHHRLLKEKKGVSLERSSPWIPVSDPNNWKSASSSDGFATPGYRNSTNLEINATVGITVEPKIFSPDGIGEQNYTTIKYTLDQTGITGTISIYSVGGAIVKEICQNAIWGNNGIYTWDGTDQSGRRVRPGYYVVWVELFDLSGNVNQIKKTVAIGTKF